MTRKNAFQRGFTLIELMIVIVILGILMGTILPRLTGAQSRARDTARRADLSNIAQALEVYFADFGEYPPMPTNGCLDANDKTVAQGSSQTTYQILGSYMKGGKVPAAVSKSQKTLGCVGAYFYKPLSSGGIQNAGYVLASDMETYQMANYDVGSGTADASHFAATAEPKDIAVKLGKLTQENANDQSKTIYVVVP